MFGKKTITAADAERAHRATASFVRELQTAVEVFPEFAALGHEAEATMDQAALAKLLSPSVTRAMRKAAAALYVLNTEMAKASKR
ncbi:hypothetical protein SAMN05444161_5573 [Rhizobiales bacterium GAS191]|nr:hypothetical protein SAMN05444161_5573 [Rhizobiales bacterium GAS191]